MIPKEEVGRRMRAARKARGFSLKSVAEQVDMTESNLSKIERGLTGTTIDNLHEISKVLGVEEDWLVSARPSQPEIDPELRDLLRKRGLKYQRQLHRTLIGVEGPNPLSPWCIRTKAA